MRRDYRSVYARLHTIMGPLYIKMTKLLAANFVGLMTSCNMIT